MDGDDQRQDGADDGANGTGDDTATAGGGSDE